MYSTKIKSVWTLRMYFSSQELNILKCFCIIVNINIVLFSFMRKSHLTKIKQFHILGISSIHLPSVFLSGFPI